MRKVSIFAAVFAAIIVGFLPPSPGRAEAAPGEVIDEFHGFLLAAMRAPDYAARAEILGPVIAKYFQTRTISRISLGGHWRKLSPQQQENYQRLIQALVVSTYASRFDAFDGQSFLVNRTEVIADKRHRVKSVLNTKSETVTLDYQLQQEADGWKIYDIVANGVSDLSLKRSNYSAIFRQGGLEAVEAEISRHIAANRAPDANAE